MKIEPLTWSSNKTVAEGRRPVARKGEWEEEEEEREEEEY